MTTNPRSYSKEEFSSMMPLEVFQNVLHGFEKRPSFTTAPLDLPLPSPISQHDPFFHTPDVRTLEDLGQEVRRLFNSPCETQKMLRMSAQMKEQYYERLRSSTACMLPSFCRSLPSGSEKGTYLALDVGGSTFRLALVQLDKQTNKENSVSIKRMSVFKIDESIRRLPSAQFFDWIAQRISAIIQEDPDVQTSPSAPIPLGLAWSFPIEQTSHRSGKIQGAGKGFAFHNSALGQDLGELIEKACTDVGLSVKVDAIINDSLATLLSQSYVDSTTSMGLITGTGMNAAVFLPLSCLDRNKFGVRDEAWYSKAQRVIINTELSMFGKGILPETRWDETLNVKHQMPDFQPLEYMTTGRYLGEILRLIIVEAVETCNLFGGTLPSNLRQQYTLDTALLAMVEEDQSRNFTHSATRLQTEFGLARPPSVFEVAFLRTVATSISDRAAAYLAVAIHGLWLVQKETDINPTTPRGTPKTSVACNGSVVLKYPGLKARCESHIARMVSIGSGAGMFTTEKIVLEPTYEAAIVGAAVAVAMGEGA